MDVVGVGMGVGGEELGDEEWLEWGFNSLEVLESWGLEWDGGEWGRKLMGCEMEMEIVFEEVVEGK